MLHYLSFCCSLFALVILVLINPQALLAQDVAAGSVGQLGFGALIARMMPMLFMIFFVFYFMVVRPQQSKICLLYTSPSPRD